jgi:hypothetical protein
MLKKLPFLVATVLCGAYPLTMMAQERPTEHPAPAPHEAAPPHANNGHIPPPPTKREAPAREEHPAPNHPPAAAPVRQHVENDKWVGHDTNDARYHMDHPYPHGHFAKFGQQYRYSVARVDVGAREFWFPGGFYFQVASWDWPEAQNWCWTTCPDAFVVYEDPDHPGWYLVYNSETGEYVHAEYMGG